MSSKAGKTRCRYSKEDVIRVLAAIRDGMSQRAASDTFKVPASTLRDRIKGRVEINATPGMYIIKYHGKFDCLFLIILIYQASF